MDHTFMPLSRTDIIDYLMRRIMKKKTTVTMTKCCKRNVYKKIYVEKLQLQEMSYIYNILKNFIYFWIYPLRSVVNKFDIVKEIFCLDHLIQL